LKNKKNKELKQNLVTWREDDKICELEINELIVKKKRRGYHTKNTIHHAFHQNPN
jgi:hypothetical protein